MKVVLKHTEGYGQTADIEVDGQPLAVVDRVSSSNRAAEPGPIEDPQFEVVTLEFRSWERAFEDNVASEKRLHHQWGWRYLGFGEIVSIEADAVSVDLGVLTLKLRFEGADPGWLGEYVAIPIERIALSRGGAER
jgi:hypothetical protein